MKKKLKKLLKKLFKTSKKKTVNKEEVKETKKPFIELGDNWNDENKPVAYMFGFNPWKREHISKFFPEYRTAFVFGSVNIKRLKPYLNNFNQDIVFIIWGYKDSDEVTLFAKENGIKLIRTEDGFIRSLGLGAAHTLPLSIVADDIGLYFNSQEPSRLEDILQSYDFKNNPDLLKSAETCINKLVNNGLSKYNHLAPVDMEKVYGPKLKKRILVIGQVEDDASIKYGSNKKMTNNELVWRAFKENPDAEIIYKPHPDVLSGHRDELSDPKAVEHFAKVVTQPISLVDSLKTIDHVYTITSLSGFEALIRGIRVTCFGLPFYAGWGLTDDRQENPRRNRKLTVQELFAGAYLLYPRYISPFGGELSECEDVIDYLVNLKSKQITGTKQKAEAKDKEMKNEKLPYEEIGKNWKDKSKPIAYIFGVIKWKRENISKFFPEYRTAFITGDKGIEKIKPFLPEGKNFVFIVWAFKEKQNIREFANQNHIPLYRIEDGFLRSVGLGVDKTEQMSIVVDDKSLYINANEPSRLEHILQTYDFKNDPTLIKRARLGIDQLTKFRLSKYNHLPRTNVEEIYGEKTKKRILVIGQVGNDASIKYGCDREVKNNDLVRLARKENPDAEIIYKPHPDVLGGRRALDGDPMEVADIAKVVTTPLSLVDSLETIDHVYTITSLSGFEALIRGIKVTCFGLPFYAGWGLTDDRQVNKRRTRKLTIEELFAASYILYPKYLNMQNNTLTSFEYAVTQLAEEVAEARFKDGVNAQNNKQMDSAEGLIKEALELNPIEIKYYVKYAQLLSNKSEFHKSIEVLESSLKLDGTNQDLANVYLELAKVNIKLGDYSNATIDLLYKCIKLDDKWPAYYLLIDHLYKTKGLTRSLMSIMKYVQNKNKSLPADKILKFAAIYNDGGFYTEALSLYNKALEANKALVEEKCYLALTATVTERYPELPGASIEAYNLYKQVEASQKEFVRLVKEANGDVCVVGNSPIELNTGNGENIDSHNLIIRFNNYSTDYPHSKDYGTKTDIWIKSGHYADVKRRDISDYKHIIVSGPNSIHRSPYGADLFKEYVDAGKSVGFFPHSLTTEVISKIEAPPSAGILVLYWLYKLTGPLKRENVYGFSFTDQLENKSSHYFSDASSGDFYHHNWKAERKLFDSLFIDSHNTLSSLEKNDAVEPIGVK